MSDIFISYRRDDSADICDRLQDRLMWRLGKQRVFRDVTGILAGSDWLQSINQHIVSADVVIVVIGPHWYDIRDGQGQQRIIDPQDLVHREVATAIRLGKVIIPVLVNGAMMPLPQSLPPDIAQLALFPPIILRPDPWFATDFKALMKTILPYIRHTPSSWTVLIGTAASLLSFFIPFIIFGFTRDSTSNILAQGLIVLSFIIGIVVVLVYAPILAMIRRDILWLSILGASLLVTLIGIIVHFAIRESLLGNGLAFFGAIAFYIAVIGFGLFGRPPRRKRPMFSFAGGHPL
jgi:hypothetical protein